MTKIIIQAPSISPEFQLVLVSNVDPGFPFPRTWYSCVENVEVCGAAGGRRTSSSCARGTLNDDDDDDEDDDAADDDDDDADADDYDYC